MTRYGAVVACAGALVAFASPHPAHAQSADLVLCDRLAADPADPDKPADVKGATEIIASDVPTAIRFCKIASAGPRRALYQLGRAYAANRQMPDAIAAWRKAADKGSSAAMAELGVMYANGTGVARDDAQARKLLERAAEAGNPRAVANLAALSSNTGAQTDPVKARAQLSKAAETNVEAQYQLGLMIAEGEGGPKGRCFCAGLVREGGGAGACRRARADGRVRPSRARRTEGCERCQSLLREGRAARQ